MWCLESLADEIILHVASQNLKTLQLVQAEVATWKRALSCVGLYCGNILFVALQNNHCGNNYFARFYSLTDSVFR